MILPKVICIDDDPIALLLSKLVISKANFASEIITLPNGQDALSFLEQQQIADHEQLIILLDLNMPVMDGWEFLEQFSDKIYQIHHNAKIILLSSSIDPNDIQKSRQFNMVLDFFPKPLTKEMLYGVLEKLNA